MDSATPGVAFGTFSVDLAIASRMAGMEKSVRELERPDSGPFADLASSTQVTSDDAGECRLSMLRTENPRGIAGSTSDGLAAVRSGLEAAHTTNEAELLRFEGELVQATATDPQRSVTLLERAVGLAKRQAAHLLELRALISLARNRGAQPGSAELRRPIAEVFEQLTLPSDSETKSLVKVDSDLDGSAPSHATRRYSSSGCGDQDSLSASGILELVRQRPKAAPTRYCGPP